MQDYFTFSLQNVGICMKYGYFFAKFPNKNAPNLKYLKVSQQNTSNLRNKTHQIFAIKHIKSS